MRTVTGSQNDLVLHPTMEGKPYTTKIDVTYVFPRPGLSRVER